MNDATTVVKEKEAGKRTRWLAPVATTARCRSPSKIHEDAAVPGSRSHGDHRPFTAISVILQHVAILNTYCGVEAYEHEPYGG